MDQKWTKRQNERPPESPEIELRPFGKEVKCQSTTCNVTINVPGVSAPAET